MTQEQLGRGVRLQAEIVKAQEDVIYRMEIQGYGRTSNDNEELAEELRTMKQRLSDLQKQFDEL